MQWVHEFQLFLFDFDGVLVNTESLHFEAYRLMCAKRGFSLKWDWPTYAKAAMYSATALQEALYRELPSLYAQEPNWRVLYLEKKALYRQLLLEKGAPLMPGVAPLLDLLDKEGIKRCVVTHSPKEHIELLKEMHPLLQTIPHWITREDYSEPKPSPECYKKAIECYLQEGERAIGFEDSPRGLKALLGSRALAFFLTALFSKEEARTFFEPFSKKVHHAPSFLEVGSILNGN